MTGVQTCALPISTANDNPADAKLKITGSGHFYPVNTRTSNIGSSSSQFANINVASGNYESVILANIVPASTTNALYNNAGTLSFNGSAVGGGAAVLSTKETVLTTGTAQTFTRDSNCLFAQIIVIGGGGGGGNATNSTTTGSASGGGGGAGGAAIVWYTAAEIGATATYTVGGGGTGASVAGGTGTTGSASTFVATAGTLTANGGAGGAGINTANATQATAGGNGGTASGGQYNFTEIGRAHV